MNVSMEVPDPDHTLLVPVSSTTRQLETLTTQHQTILASLVSPDQERVSQVKRTLDQLDLGVNEGRLMLTIINYLETLESDQAETGLQLVKIKDENDWLREELEEAERRLEEVLATIAGLEVEREQHALIQEVGL